MEYRSVGSSGVGISRVGLGDYQLGPEPDEAPEVDRAVRVIESAIACGMNWLDTSENYLEQNESVIGPAGALNPVMIDRERDEGVKRSPNVWMVHAVA